MSGMHEMTGRCHCGNISFKFLCPIPKIELPIRSCDCSFCSRQGACYTSHPQGSLQVRVADRVQTKLYRFGSEQADVFLCINCGIFPFILTEIDAQQYAVLNANCINGLHIDLTALPPALQLENQTEQERLARWKRFWIPQVKIEYRSPRVNATLL